MPHKRLSNSREQLENADRAVAASQKLLDQFLAQRRLDAAELVRQTESLKKMRERIARIHPPFFRTD